MIKTEYFTKISTKSKRILWMTTRRPAANRKVTISVHWADSEFNLNVGRGLVETNRYAEKCGTDYTFHTIFWGAGNPCSDFTVILGIYKADGGVFAGQEQGTAERNCASNRKYGANQGE